MKGTPEAPQCGFSRAVCQILDVQVRFEPTWPGHLLKPSLNRDTLLPCQWTTADPFDRALSESKSSLLIVSRIRSCVRVSRSTRELIAIVMDLHIQLPDGVSLAMKIGAISRCRSTNVFETDLTQRVAHYPPGVRQRRVCRRMRHRSFK